MPFMVPFNVIQNLSRFAVPLVTVALPNTTYPCKTSLLFTHGDAICGGKVVVVVDGGISPLIVAVKSVVFAQSLMWILLMPAQ